jgi:hypothetical protein
VLVIIDGFKIQLASYIQKKSVPIFQNMVGSLELAQKCYKLDPNESSLLHNLKFFPNKMAASFMKNGEIINYLSGSNIWT